MTDKQQRPSEQLKAKLQEANAKKVAVLARYAGKKLTVAQRLERLELLHGITDGGNP